MRLDLALLLVGAAGLTACAYSSSETPRPLEPRPQAAAERGADVATNGGSSGAEDDTPAPLAPAEAPADTDNPTTWAE